MMGGACQNRPYGYDPVRLDYRRKDNPYASMHRTKEEHGPVNLDNTYPLKIMPVHLNSFAGLCSAMNILEPLIRLYLRNHSKCIITGDWHFYTNLRKWIVVNGSEDYVHNIVPVPGMFHIALNTQDSIIKKFFDPLCAIWKFAHPSSKF